MTKNTYTNNQLNEAGFTDEDHDKVRALCSFLNCEPSELSLERHSRYDMAVFSYGNQEYAVATDEEADIAWNQSLDSYIEECIEPELNFDKLGSLGNYVKFDREMWIRDAKMDGRGHSLSPYDGEENEEKIGDAWFYIYRTN